MIRSSHKNLPIKVNQSDDPTTGGGTKVLTRPEQKLKKPPMYKVLLLNDDYTPMDFVVHVLKQFFRKSEPEASKIMMEVHTKGAGLAGIYPHEIAETKVFQVNSFSQKNQHPLKCTMEEEKIDG